MYGVPLRFALFLSSLSGRVDTKSLDEDIPRGAKSLDKKCLAEWYPDILAGEEPTRKIFKFEVLRFLDGSCVLPESVEERITWVRSEPEPSLSCARRHGLADVYR